MFLRILNSAACDDVRVQGCLHPHDMKRYLTLNHLTNFPFKVDRVAFAICYSVPSMSVMLLNRTCRYTVLCVALIEFGLRFRLPSPDLHEFHVLPGRGATWGVFQREDA